MRLVVIRGAGEVVFELEQDNQEHDHRVHRARY